MSESASKDTPEQAEFRQHCKSWLQDNTPGEPPVRLPLSALEIMTSEQLTYLQAWQKSAYDAGLVGTSDMLEAQAMFQEAEDKLSDAQCIYKIKQAYYKKACVK